MPFADGRTSGQPIDILTGFVDKDGKALGRRAGIAIDKAGAPRCGCSRPLLALLRHSKIADGLPLSTLRESSHGSKSDISGDFVEAPSPPRVQTRLETRNVGSRWAKLHWGFNGPASFARATNSRPDSCPRHWSHFLLDPMPSTSRGEKPSVVDPGARETRPGGDRSRTSRGRGITSSIVQMGH
jgi:hypothetical protein